MRQQMRELVEETYAMSARRKVLIFDEDVEALSKHAEPFETQGIEVHRCTTVEAAMRCVQREDFDLALIDQGSSGSEGRRVIGYLVRYNLRTPFIVLARSTDAAWYEQAITRDPAYGPALAWAAMCHWLPVLARTRSVDRI